MQIYLKPLRWYLFFNLVFGGISNVCTALLPYFTQELVRGHYQIALYGYCLAVLCYLGCNYIQMRLDWKQAILFSTHLKNDCFWSWDTMISSRKRWRSTFPTSPTTWIPWRRITCHLS